MTSNRQTFYLFALVVLLVAVVTALTITDHDVPELLGSLLPAAAGALFGVIVPAHRTSAPSSSDGADGAADTAAGVELDGTHEGMPADDAGEVQP
jgi:hypothetical protein